jgi:hypothetical protein
MSKNIQFIIYGLVDPITKQIRYIGKSSYGLKRPKEHFKPSNYLTQKNHKAHWIKSLIEQGLKPGIVILKEASTEAELSQLEIDTIREYKEKYGNLTNSTDGGEGSLGWIPTEKTKRNISQGRKRYLEALTEPLKAVNKKEHVMVDNVECKICVTCKEPHPLLNFSTNKNTWDKLHIKCKPCAKEYTKQFRLKNPAKKLTPEELAQSYIDRKEAMAAGVKRAHESNTEYKQKISLRNSKAIEGTNVTTGEKIYFNSALEAKTAGFSNSNLGQSIRKGIPYRGYLWKFI